MISFLLYDLWSLVSHGSNLSLSTRVCLFDFMKSYNGEVHFLTF